MSEILYVTKPMGPPWNDGTKTLVRDLARGLTRHHPVVLGMRDRPFELPRGRVEALFPPSEAAAGVHGSWAMRLTGRLVAGPRADLWHFVFAPVARTSRVSRALARLRRVPTVQTVPSLPAVPPRELRALGFADRVVVLSRATERAFLESGVPPSKLRRIAPCVAPLRWSHEMHAAGRRAFGLPQAAPVIVFPGDLEAGRGAREIIDAFGAMPPTLGAVLIMAARKKSRRSGDAERALRARATELGVAASIRWVGETPMMHHLLACADVVALPARDLTAKVDLPIVLLEAMSLGRAVVVAAGTSAAELADGAAAIASAVDAAALAHALADIISDTVARNELGIRAAKAIASYGPERMAREYETLYDELLP